MLLSFGFEWTALSKQSMNAYHPAVERPLNLFISNFGNLARILTFKVAVPPCKSSPDWGLELTFPVEALGVEVIREFIWRDFRVESIRTTAHVISSVILLASATSCSMNSCSLSPSTSSKILLSRLFKVSSYSLSMMFCCESLSCNESSDFLLNPQLVSWHVQDDLRGFFFVSWVLQPLLSQNPTPKGHLMNLFCFPTYNNKL